MNSDAHHPDAFTDIHCHLLPAIDDGARSWEETLAMAQMACDDGVGTIIATPHQLGSFAHNSADLIRSRVAEVQRALDQQQLGLRVLPGADVRIEPELAHLIRTGAVLTLADQRRHVLLELPHELCFPLHKLLDQLHAAGLVGILSHPERNQELASRPEQMVELVEAGFLMQITAGSLHGAFGPRSRHVAQWMLREGLVHFVASDAHGPHARRPLLSRAFNQVSELTDLATAQDLFVHHPRAVCRGETVPAGRRLIHRIGWAWWRGRRKAG